MRTFVEPNRIEPGWTDGEIAEIAEMHAFEVMQSEVAAEAVRNDGVCTETLLLLVES
ncbi:MAG: hypothetical protein ABSD85_07475 [Acidimicrobiales bacterium]